MRQHDAGGSTCIGKEPCPNCGSRDNLARYDDGHGYCFGCGHYERGDGEAPTHKTERRVSGDLIRDTKIETLRLRKLSAETCKKFNYGVGEFKGKPAQVAPYHDKDGRLVAQKVRLPGKEFITLGDFKEATLFGQHLWRNNGGKRLVITEGEIDAMSVAQAMNLTWPVVSVPNGAQGAAKSIKKNLEFVESFDEVVFMFDMDEPGQEAARKCVELLSPGKAKIASLPLKDANEMLKADRVKEIVTAVWEARVSRPDGIVSGADLWEAVDRDLEQGIPYPWEDLNGKLYGLRKGELVTLSAGSGVGKSAVCAELAYDLAFRHEQKVGYIALEESVARSALRFLSIHLNKPIHLPGHGVTDEEKRSAFNETLAKERVFFYDHFGSLDSDNLLQKIRYMVRALGCDFIVLDHLSIVVSGMDLEGDERRLLDFTMTALRSLVQELGCGMLLVSHLKRPPGTSHEEGGQTSLSQLRGSAAIGQLSDAVLGLERDQQAETEEARNTTFVRILKNRYAGITGIGCALRYDRESGRLEDVQFAEGEDGPVAESGEGNDDLG